MQWSEASPNQSKVVTSPTLKYQPPLKPENQAGNQYTNHLKLKPKSSNKTTHIFHKPMAQSLQSNPSAHWSMTNAPAHTPSKYWLEQWILALFQSTITPNPYYATWNPRLYQMRQWHTQLTRRKWSKASKMARSNDYLAIQKTPWHI